MAALDRVIASMSPDDTTAALRPLKVLEECREMSPTEAEEWRRQITGWARWRRGEAAECPSPVQAPRVHGRGNETIRLAVPVLSDH